MVDRVLLARNGKNSLMLSCLDGNLILLGYDRERGAISAVQGGTIIIGAIIGDASGGLGRWARSISIEPDVRSGGPLSLFRSSPGCFISSVVF